jgi:hypothetical protein
LRRRRSTGNKERTKGHQSQEHEGEAFHGLILRINVSVTSNSCSTRTKV